MKTLEASNGQVASETSTALVVQLRPILIQRIQIRLVGDSALICNRWSEKAKKQMLDKQMKKARSAKEAKNPKEQYRESLYRLPGKLGSGKLGVGYGFPAIGFKSAAVEACSHIDGITKVLARGAFHVVGDLVKIEGTPRMREDMVRVGMGVADIRYRGEFPTWACTIEVRYNANVLSAEQIINLFNTAGFAIGVGEWRPQRDGSYGMFHVEAH